MDNEAQFRSGRKNEPEKKPLSGLIASGKIFQLLRRHYVLYVVMLLACLATVAVRHQFTPSYRSKATLILQAAINNPLQSLSTRLGGFSGFDVDGREADRYLSRLRVYAFYLRSAQAVRADPTLVDVPKAKFVPMESLRSAYNARFKQADNRKVSELSDDELARRLMSMVTLTKDGIEAVSIHITASDPEIAYRLNNLVARSAVDALIDFEEQDLRESDYYLKIQSRKTEDSIRETEKAIAGFKKSKNLFTINSNFEQATNRSAEITREIADIDLQLNENRREIQALAHNSREAEDGAGAGFKFGTRRKIASIDKESEALESRRGNLKKMMRELQATYDPNSEQELTELKKKIDLESSLFQELKKHDFQMEMRRISARNKFHLLEPARLDSVQISEGLLSKMLVGALIALIMSAMVTYVVEIAFPLVSGRSDLEEAGIRFLGSIPDGRARRSIFQSLVQWRQPFRKAPRAGSLDEITASVSQICAVIMSKKDLQSQANSGWLVVVTSSVPGEGKTFTAKNLATAMAENKRRVLLIDGDLRSPSLSSSFNAFKNEGFAEVLLNRELFGKLRLAQVSPGLDFLPAGQQRKNPTKLFASTHFEELVGGLKGLYDFVVVDTPPASVAGDSSVIMRVSDFPVMVVGQYEIYLHVLHASLNKVEDFCRGHVYGILNKVPFGQQYSYMRYGRPRRMHIVPTDSQEDPVARFL